MCALAPITRRDWHRAELAPVALLAGAALALLALAEIFGSLMGRR